MAGRAGRRGKDQTGSCLICLDKSFGRQSPSLDDFERLLENKGNPLESKLKLSYSMTMNVMKSESMVIEDILKVSWFENESEKERNDALKEANKVQKLISLAENFDCPYGCTYQDIHKYGLKYKEVCAKNRNIMTIESKSVEQKCIVEALSPEFFGEPVVVIQSLKERMDDQIVCLYINRNYQAKERFEDRLHPAGAPAKKSRSGYSNGVYYEFIALKPDQIGKIYNEYLQLKMNFFLDKDGLLVRIHS